MRVVIISHGHPRFARGGGEVAAYNLFQGINNSKRHEAWLLARAPQPLLHLGTQLAQIEAREYLFHGEAECENLCASLELGQQDEFALLLKRLKPDVIHFHHYYYVGIEVLRVARLACPEAKLVLTFHEYMAICAMHGTMVKQDMRLCYQASPRDCQQCLPERGPDWFFLREQYLKSFLQLVDHYVAPSHFLAQRYIDWGLTADKFSVIDNGISSHQRQPPRPLAAGEGRAHFAFFGQCHPYKGLDLILEAIGNLPKALRSRIRLDVHASGLEQMQGDYPQKLKALLKRHKDFAQYHGPYEQHELPQLMAACDWVLMGSIWWENSPLVIQEAWKFGRPVICPDLGGMAEKVRPGIGGLLYRARSAAALADLVRELAAAPDDSRYQQLLAQLPQHSSIETCTREHLQLYRR